MGLQSWVQQSHRDPAGKENKLVIAGLGKWAKHWLKERFTDVFCNTRNVASIFL